MSSNPTIAIESHSVPKSHSPKLQGAGSDTHGSFSTEQSDVYRSISRTSLISFLLGLLGISAFAVVHLVVLPAVGLVLGWMGRNSIKRYPAEFSGLPLAVIGIAVSGITLLAAPAYHAYVYATEVPEGFSRVSFYELTAPKGQPDVPTNAALKWDGQPVFIKGYVHPTSMTSAESDKFVIVPDLGTCCFGGQPPLTHMIEVQLNGEQYAHRNLRKKSLAGTFSVNQSLKPIEGLTGVYYRLQADLLK